MSTLSVHLFEYIVCTLVLLEFAVHELLLPDVAMVHGRFIVSAWEFGLDGIQDDAVKLLSHAVEVCAVMFMIVFDDCCLRFRSDVTIGQQSR